jgi:hypothetical protein
VHQLAADVSRAEGRRDTFEIHQRRQIEDIIEEFGEDTNMKKVDSRMEKGLNLPINTTADPRIYTPQTIQWLSVPSTARRLQRQRQRTQPQAALPRPCWCSSVDRQVHTS